MWAKIMKERFGATDEKAQMIRFHTQTGGVTLQAQQPEVNIIRVALQGFAAVAGGTQSLHTNGFDEALALPTERSARIALRTQQVLAHESGVADTVDPFAGSYFIESLTDEIEERSWELMGKVEEMGGSVNALDFMQREIEESASSYHERYRTGQDIIVGVNKYETDVVDDVDILKVDPAAETRQLKRLAAFKEARDQTALDAKLDEPARRRPRRGQPAAPDQGGAARRRLDRRRLQRDARRLRRVQGRGVLLGVSRRRSRTPVLSSISRALDGPLRRRWNTHEARGRVHPDRNTCGDADPRRARGDRDPLLLLPEGQGDGRGGQGGGPHRPDERRDPLDGERGRLRRAGGVTVPNLMATEQTLTGTALTVPMVTANSYTVRVQSATGNTFDIRHNSDGTVDMSCATAGHGGCPSDGNWGQ